ncbi:MAG TPA: hypothetical protein VEX15_02875 [Nocardioidaceae bacterium]|nr:hypothetical protein [Nocardioidaceae bacterium]
MTQLEGPQERRRRLLSLTAGAIVVVSLLLVTGLAMPGFMDDSGRGSPLPETPTGSVSPGSEQPWAQLHPSPRKLTPDAALARLATGFVGRLNGHRAADAVEMLCPDKRRLIRGAVVWTATHRPHLRITTPFKNAARPGYVTVKFVGAIGGHQRRGTIGVNADRAGRPNCVSAFYSVG